MTKDSSSNPEKLENEQEIDSLAHEGENQQAAENLPDEEKLKEEISTLKNQLLRSIADQENLRKRSEREKADMAKYAITNFAKELITVADNFERALKSVPEDSLESNDVAKTLIDGIKLTEVELLRVLSLVGVQKLEPKIGDKFDPNFHQAMFEVADSELPKGHVAQVIQIGYTHHDRLLRPAMIGVSKEKSEEQ